MADWIIFAIYEVCGEPFLEGRHVAEYAGNGLGLAIVKAIVLARGVDVSVQSQPGQGTAISIFLPAESVY